MPTWIHEAREQLVRGIVDNVESGCPSHDVVIWGKKINKNVQRNKPPEMSHAASNGGFGNRLKIDTEHGFESFIGIHV